MSDGKNIGNEKFQYLKENGRKLDFDEYKKLFPLFEPGPGPVLSKAYGKNNDLTTNAGTGKEAIGQRITISGRVLDEDGDPIPNAFIEIWQANAAGRYIHKLDEWPAPLDPNFVGSGWTHTDEDGLYEFTTIKAGNYCWLADQNYWRPAHIHYSVMGPNLNDRLITQLYFEGDPLLKTDTAIYLELDEEDRKKTVATYSKELTEPDWALGYEFDIVLRGSEASPSIANDHQLTEEDREELEIRKEENNG